MDGINKRLDRLEEDVRILAEALRGLATALSKSQFRYTGIRLYNDLKPLAKEEKPHV